MAKKTGQNWKKNLLQKKVNIEKWREKERDRDREKKRKKRKTHSSKNNAWMLIRLTIVYGVSWIFILSDKWSCVLIVIIYQKGNGLYSLWVLYGPFYIFLWLLIMY